MEMICDLSLVLGQEVGIGHGSCCRVTNQQQDKGNSKINQSFGKLMFLLLGDFFSIENIEKKDRKFRNG